MAAQSSFLLIDLADANVLNPWAEVFLMKATNVMMKLQAQTTVGCIYSNLGGFYI